MGNQRQQNDLIPLRMQLPKAAKQRSLYKKDLKHGIVLRFLSQNGSIWPFSLLFLRMQVILLAFTPAFLHMKLKPFIVLHNTRNYQSWHIVFVLDRYYTVALFYLIYCIKSCHFKR